MGWTDGPRKGSIPIFVQYWTQFFQYVDRVAFVLGVTSLVAAHRTDRQSQRKPDLWGASILVMIRSEGGVMIKVRSNVRE